MTEYLPQVRCTPKMKAALESIARKSVAPNLSDHVRFAVEQYIVSSTPDPHIGGVWPWADEDAHSKETTN